jgi:DNA-binding MarR family transcriptional regulator
MPMKRNKLDQMPTYKKAMIQVAAYRRIRNVVNTVLNRFNLNTTEWMILGVLYESATGLRTTDIANMLEVEVPLITRLSRILAKEGLIQNSVNSRDRREKPLSLTERGNQMIAKVERALARRTERLEDGLSDGEVTNYFTTLSTFMDNAIKP